MNSIENLKNFRENKLLKMTKKYKEEGFVKFLECVKELGINREKELEILCKIRGE